MPRPRDTKAHRLVEGLSARTYQGFRQVFNAIFLDGVEGNKSRAAKILGIDRKTLREKLKRIKPQGA
jgi:DNA-binding NtrC family response regulator